AVSGSVSRTRRTASRIAAVFAACTASSTTRCGLEDGTCAEPFDRLEVEIFENGPHLALHAGAPVDFHEQLTVAEDAVSKRRRRFIEHDEIDGASCRLLERRGQRPER